MRIAIIGGGASGLVAAHLLDGAHRVSVFEKQPILGGHVRTLGRNVSVEGLPAELHLDAGVIEFSRDYFGAFHRLMDRLGVRMREVPCTTTLHPLRGPHLLSLEAIEDAGLHGLARLRATLRLLPLAAERRRFLRRVAKPKRPLRETPLGELLTDGPLGSWLALLVTYAYSIPYPSVREVSGALAGPMLQDFVRGSRWTAVEGGTFAYMEAILDRLAGEVQAGVRVEAVRRSSDGVELVVEGERRSFDAVVFATPPDQVLELLADATDDERRRFGAHRPNPMHVLLHDDLGPHARRGVSYRSEFDMFELDGGKGGYNARLDRLCGVPDSIDRPFALAFGLDEEIDPERVLHVQEHHAPDLGVEALRWRDEVRACNGERRTWHVGAWLGDGLHEGAVRSALAVAEALGGTVL